MAWMNAETLRETLETGRMVFWSRSPPGVVVQGRHVGRPSVRPRGVLRLRRRHAAVRGRAGGQGRVPHRRVLLLLPRVRRERRPQIAPTLSRAEFQRPWRASHRRAGLARAAGRPRSRRSPRSPGWWATSPASCSSRSSTASAGAAGRSSAATRRPRSSPRRAHRGRRHARRRRAARRGRARRDRGRCSPCTDRRRCPSLPPLARRAHRLPRLRRRARGRAPARRAARRPSVFPTRCCRSSAAGRVRPLAPARHARSRTCRCDPGSTDAELDAAYDEAVARLDERLADGGPSAPTSRVEPPEPDDPLPDVRSSMGARVVPAARSRWRRSTSSPATSSRSCSSQRFDLDLDADPFDVYRVLRQVNPSPYMYFVRQPEVTIVGLVARADGAAARRHVSSRGRSPAPGAADAPTRRIAGSAAELQRAPEGDRRARHAGRPGPQRRRPRGARSAPSRSTR